MSTGTTAQALAAQLAELKKKSEAEIGRLNKEINKTKKQIDDLEAKLEAAKNAYEDYTQQRDLLTGAVASTVGDAVDNQSTVDEDTVDADAADEAAGTETASEPVNDAVEQTEEKPKKPAARKKPVATKTETKPEPKKPATAKPKTETKESHAVDQPPFPDPWADAADDEKPEAKQNSVEDVDLVFSQVPFGDDDEDDDVL